MKHYIMKHRRKQLEKRRAKLIAMRGWIATPKHWAVAWKKLQQAEAKYLRDEANMEEERT